VLAYYLVLRTAMRSRRDLRRCLTRCRHCRIFFVAHPRNGGRADLGCPFGCREAYRKKRSAERSVAYYRTAAGKEKKAQLNSRRREGSGGDRRVVAQRPATPAAESDVIEFDAAIVAHVRVVVSLVERREVSREEIVAMLERTVRQRRIGRQGRRAYILRWLAEHPPRDP